MINLQDIRDLRRMSNTADAQRFLATKGIPVDQWDNYLKLVALDYKPDNDVTIVVRDPGRHWLWAMLNINGCSYRLIAEYYNVRHASVYEAVKRHYSASPVRPSKLRDKCSLERMSALVYVHAGHPDKFPRINLMAEASLLSELADQIGD